MFANALPAFPSTFINLFSFSPRVLFLPILTSFSYPEQRS